MFGFLFNPNGRVTLKGIWLGFLLPLVAIFAALHYSREFIGPAAGIGILVMLLFYLWPSIAVPAKRLHDIGLTGWILGGFVLAYFIFFCLFIFAIIGEMDMEAVMAAQESGEPYEPTEEESIAMVEGALKSSVTKIAQYGSIATAAISFILLYLVPGKKGDNKYGPDPRG
jgi:uncharacterized membrane protein YhaH (DUF805 family)